jgi:outer membrane lipoprotein-sorting protein
MSERNERHPVDVLDLATAALRDVSIPDGPPPQLAASTVEALQSASSPPDIVRLEERKRKMLRLMRYSGVAAAVVLLAALAGWLFLMDRTAALAFADVVEKVKNARSVTFITKIPTVVQGNQRGVLQQKFYIQGDRYRMELPSAQEGVPVPPDAPPVLVAIIADAKQKKVLQLDFVRKTAQYIEADEKRWQQMAQELANPIEKLRQLKNEDAERLGEEELDGRKTQVYRLKKADVFMGVRLGKDETARLWADPKSGLPVRLAVGDPSDKDKPFIVFEQFSWNEALDLELFKLEVPKGFTLKDK